MSIEATLFTPPHGAQQQITINNIYPEDAAWFKEHGAKLSMEELAGDAVCYADVGVRTDEGDEVEALEISMGRTCEDTLQALRKQCEQMLTQFPNKIVPTN